MVGHLPIFLYFLSLAWAHSDCIVKTDDYTHDFSAWRGSSVVANVSMEYTEPLTAGYYLFDLIFCETVTVVSVANGWGWNYGVLTDFFENPNTSPFTPLPPKPSPQPQPAQPSPGPQPQPAPAPGPQPKPAPAPGPQPQPAPAPGPQPQPATPQPKPALDILVDAYEQVYSDGDLGPPCVGGKARSSLVQVFCDSDATCAQIPNSQGSACLAGDVNKICVCSVYFNVTRNRVCSGLVINVLSHNCPAGSITPLNPPDDGGPSTVGIVFLVLFLLVIAIFIGGYAYNYKIHGLRGAYAVPLYSTCCGDRAPKVNYYETPDIYGSSGLSGSFDRSKDTYGSL